MRLAVLLVTSSIIIGCGTLPEKPVIEICLIDYPRAEVICGLTDSNSLQNASYEEIRTKAMQASDVVRKPLIYVDKAVALIPAEWEKIENYRKALERYAREQCQP
jgi:hypothetical protein